LLFLLSNRKWSTQKQQVQICLHQHCWRWLGPHSSWWPAWIDGCLHAWSPVAQLHAASPWRHRSVILPEKHWHRQW
jgi:hypothetical protein